MNIVFGVIGALIGLIIGFPAGYLVLRRHFRTKYELRWEEAQTQLAKDRRQAFDKAQKEAEESLAEARDEQQSRAKKERRSLQKFEAKLQRLEDRLHTQEETLDNREKVLEEKLGSCDRREAKLLKREAKLETAEQAAADRQQALDNREREFDAKLAEVAGLSREQAQEQLFARLDEELATEQSERISRYSKDLEARKQELAKEIVSRAIQRFAAEHTAETTTAVVKLADDDLKGRIIGKEGRNIRAFEQATGVDLIIDDTPNQITISCFDGVRREIARRALNDLLADGRIQPARIEEVLIKTQQDMDRVILKLGEDAAYGCEVSGLHPQLLKMLGKLHYRTSYGQNVLQHATEVSHVAGAMAAEMGLDPKLARRCGLLHDVGKALDHEHEGGHPELGYEALKRFGENEAVANAALAHHEGHEQTSIYTTLVAAADAISAARPGARRENVERYLKRLEQLEDIACSYKGVIKAYAIQAGRELRVIINGHTLPDNALAKVARDIAHRIEDEVAYPGEVKVTLIRETRQTAMAR